MSIGQETRRESLAKVDTLTEEAKIYEVLSRTPVPLTASETSYELGYGYNRQKTQPRINGLKDKGCLLYTSVIHPDLPERMEILKKFI